MIKQLFYSFLLLTIFACNKKNEQNNTALIKDTIYIHDYNFIIAPDLSNRINPSVHPKPVNDTLLIGEIANNIENFLGFKRQTNQSDTYKLDFINKGILNNNIVDPKNLLIDFSQFDGKPLDLSNYVRKDLGSDIKKFKKNTKIVYDYSLINPAGSDIWNYLNETINSSLTQNKIKNITPEGSLEDDPIIIKKKENILILITDGYIENINNTKGYSLNQNILEKIRQEFNKSNSKNLEQFITTRKEYLINNTQNNLKDLNILVLELYDRSKDSNGAVKVQPNDFQILKIIWEKWLKDSGAKNIEIYPTIDKKEDIKLIIEKYLQKIK